MQQAAKKLNLPKNRNGMGMGRQTLFHRSGESNSSSPLQLHTPITPKITSGPSLSPLSSFITFKGDSSRASSANSNNPKDIIGIRRSTTSRFFASSDQSDQSDQSSCSPHELFKATSFKLTPTRSMSNRNLLSSDEEKRSGNILNSSSIGSAACFETPKSSTFGRQIPEIGPTPPQFGVMNGDKGLEINKTPNNLFNSRQRGLELSNIASHRREAQSKYSPMSTTTRGFGLSTPRPLRLRSKGAGPSPIERGLLSSARAMTMRMPAPLEYIVAVIYNNPKEIGYASFNIANSHITISQFVDTTTFGLTQNLFMTFPPQTVILSNTLQETFFHNTLSEFSFGKDIKLDWIERKHFDYKKGLEIFKESKNVKSLQGKETKYLCMASLNALLVYMKSFAGNNYKSILPHTLNITYKYLNETMVIDYKTAINLELIYKINCCGTDNTLFSLFKPRTAAGKRLLKAVILNPDSNPIKINRKLDLLTQLMERAELRKELVEIFINFSDFDVLLGRYAIKLNDSINSAKQLLSGLIRLREEIGLAIPFLQLLSTISLESIEKELKDINVEEIEDIINEIDKILDIQNLHNLGHKNKSSQISFCFMAVREGVSKELDNARSEHHFAEQKCYELMEWYKDYYQTVNIKPVYKEAQGYSFSAPSALLQLEIPDNEHVIVKTTDNGKTMTGWTSKLYALNQNLKRKKSLVFELSLDCIKELVELVRNSLGSLYGLGRAIANMDLTNSFAEYILSQINIEWTRPELTSKGIIYFEESRHPILESKKSTIIPNTITLSNFQPLNIITGTNGSGKSTYLKQCALLCVMAQISCYIPAAYAKLRPITHLFTRIGLGNVSMENSSSFLVEMTDIQYIIENLNYVNISENSENIEEDTFQLVALDELCSNTSVECGIPLAWAILEYILTSGGCIGMLATHNAQINSIATLYPNVKLLHLQTTTDTTCKHLNFHYKIANGKEEAQDYGVMAAAKVGFPPVVIKNCMAIKERLIKILEGEIEEYCGSGTESLKRVFEWTWAVMETELMERLETGGPRLEELKNRIKAEAKGILK